ncbi:hypothetical protein MLD38_009225 [Melastoma candidum]|uniref:Uncharacterized protein n=1 Tax=Melastoma candidum TaxID=119954 RepID=A0ACB9RWI8_9MYRT|nr:hypothetical protein MLD38_009225 [Melastoma candidum]
MVIDSTNTSWYYSVMDMPREKGMIKHVKNECLGRDAVPSNAQVYEFGHEVDRFLLDDRHKNQYILVHCMQGHNRTGYMIIHYLMGCICLMTMYLGMKYRNTSAIVSWNTAIMLSG